MILDPESTTMHGRVQFEAWLSGKGLLTLAGLGHYLYALEGSQVVSELTQSPWSLAHTDAEKLFLHALAAAGHRVS